MLHSMQLLQSPTGLRPCINHAQNQANVHSDSWACSNHAVVGLMCIMQVTRAGKYQVLAVYSAAGTVGLAAAFKVSLLLGHRDSDWLGHVAAGWSQQPTYLQAMQL